MSGLLSSAPFSTPWLQVVDGVRLVVVTLTAVGLVGVVFRYPSVPSRHRVVLAAASVLAVSAAESGWERLGHGVGEWGRLWVNLAGTLLFASWAFMVMLGREERR